MRYQLIHSKKDYRAFSIMPDKLYYKDLNHQPFRIINLHNKIKVNKRLLKIKIPQILINLKLNITNNRQLILLKYWIRNAQSVLNKCLMVWVMSNTWNFMILKSRVKALIVHTARFHSIIVSCYFIICSKSISIWKLTSKPKEKVITAHSQSRLLQIISLLS